MNWYRRSDMEDALLEKKKVRLFIRERFQLYSQTQLSVFSQEVLNALWKNVYFREARTVLLFHSLPDEVDTHGFIERLRSEKRVLLPVIQKSDIVPVEYRMLDSLKEGAFHILEPALAPYSGTIDVAVVPGVAFDGYGHRLGRGKGFYDRFLSSNSCHKIGLCFPFQFLSAIPFEKHDVVMDDVVCGKEME